MARTPRSAAEKLAMRKKKSRALLLFNIIAFSVVVIGADRRALVAALASGAPEVPVVEVDGHEDWMFSVVNEAVALSRPGDPVVLAPACASWDQFDNYGQRGDVFAEAVHRLAAQWGSAGGDE